MSATNEHATTLSFVAGADLSSSRYLGVSLNATDRTVVVGSLAGKCVGILQNEPESGQAASVVTAGKAKMICGTTVTAGETLEMNASGQCQPKSADGEAIGTAAESGTVGGVVSVIVKPGYESIGVSRLTAGASLVGDINKLVMVGATDDNVIRGTLGADCVGVLLNAPGLAGVANVQTDGIVEVYASGAGVTLGAELVCNADGLVIDSPGTAGQFIIGKALQDQVGAGLVKVLLDGHGAYTAIPAVVRTPLVVAAAGVTLSTLVKAHTVAGEITTALAGEDAIGVALTTDAGGGTINVQIAGVATITTGAIVLAGASLMSDGTGNAITYVAAADNHIIGYALSADPAGGADINVMLGSAGWEQDLPTQLTTAMVAEAAGVTATYFVDAHTTDGEAVAITASGQRAMGVSLTTDAGAGAIVVQIAGVATVTTGAPVTAGDLIQSDNAGLAITASGTKGHYALGIALESDGGGGPIPVRLFGEYPQEGTTSRTIRSSCILAMDTNWAWNEGGYVELGFTKTTEYVIIGISDLPLGAVITGYKLLGAIASGGTNVTYTSKLRSLEAAAAGAPASVDVATDAGATKTSAYKLDDGATGLTETVAAGFTYHVWANLSTGADGTCAISGIEVTYTETA